MLLLTLNSAKQPVSSTEPEKSSNEPVSREVSFVDTNKMACLLCKRQFDSIELLNKHIAKSDLHKVRLKSGVRRGLGRPNYSFFENLRKT